MQRPDLQAIAAKWIAELRLQDRIITVRYTRNLVDPRGNQVYGLLTIQNLDEGRFLIEVQDPETWPKGGSRALSAEAIEEIPVHELVHIRWIDVTVHNLNPASIVQEERATWSTARALIRANSQQRATMVRAMMAQPAALRRQTTGKATMDSLDLILAALTAALTAEDPKTAIESLISEIKRLKGTGGDAPDSNAPPMGADAGNGPPTQEKKDDMPPANMRTAATDDAAQIRSMRAEIAGYRNEIKAAVELVRPAAKAEVVRSMRADGITLPPHAEKLILDAPTLELAKERAEGMRAMGAAPARPQVRQMGAMGGLSESERTRVEQVARTNPTRAALLHDEIMKAKAGAK